VQANTLLLFKEFVYEILHITHAVQTGHGPHSAS